MREYYIYFMTNTSNKVLYIGVTNNLIRRAQEHREGLVDGFTKKYQLKKLVYYEFTEYIHNALEREKQLKHWRREWKNALVNKLNPEWNDLYGQLMKYGD